MQGKSRQISKSWLSAKIYLLSLYLVVQSVSSFLNLKSKGKFRRYLNFVNNIYLFVALHMYPTVT